MSDEEPQAYRETVESLLAADPEVTEAQMMGMPSLKQGSKMFGGRTGEDLVLKLGRDRVGPPSDGWAGLAEEARALAAPAS